MPRTRRHEVRTPHFAVPFTFSTPSSHAAVNEQHRDENLFAQARIVLAFPVGSRLLDLPEFGREEILFKELGDDIVGKLSDALLQWIPDIDVEVDEISNLLDEFESRYRAQIITEGQG